MKVIKVGTAFGLFFLLCVWTVRAQSTQRASYGILFDNTGSMRQLIPVQQAIARAIVTRSKDQAVVSIFGFLSVASGPKIVTVATGLECSEDSDQLTKQIGEIGVVGGQTTLIDAVRSAAERLNKPIAPNCPTSGEKILVVLSDGEDRASTTTADELISFVKQSSIKIYVVGLLQDLTNDSGPTSKSPKAKSKEFLERLVAAGGGNLVLPKKKDKPEEIVEKLFSQSYKISN